MANTFTLRLKANTFNVVKPRSVLATIYPLADIEGTRLKRVKDTVGGVLISGHVKYQATPEEITAGVYDITLVDPRDTNLNPSGFAYEVHVNWGYWSETPVIRFGPTEIAAVIADGVVLLEDLAAADPVAVDPLVTYADATALADEVTRAQAAEATKVNSSTYTAGLAAKADATALTTETTRATAAETALRTGTDTTFEARQAALYGPTATPMLQAFNSVTAPTYAIPRSRPYDQQRNLYRGAATKHREVRTALGLGLAGLTLVPIMFLGDSHTAGFTAPGVVTGQAITGVSDPVTVFRNLMKAAGYPVTGGWVFPSSGGSASPARLARDVRWTFPVGTWAGGDTSSSGHVNSNTTNATALFTRAASDPTGTIADFCAFCTANTTIAVSIDGAAEVTYNLVAGSLNKFSAAGANTIQIRRSGTQRIWVGPARIRAATGLSISNAGIYGSKSSDWRADAQASAYYNPFNLAMGLETPKLALVGLGPNEALDSAAGTLASMTTDLTSVVQSAQAIAPTVMQVTAPLGDAVVDAGTVWTDWVKRMYDVADTAGALLIDHTDAMGTNAEGIANGLLYDAYHPLAAGYAAMARRVKLALEAA